MKVLQGTGVYGGVAIGHARILRRERQPTERRTAENPSEEWARVVAARTAAIDELRALCEKTKLTVGEESAAIFEIHGMMLEDSDYNAEIERLIREEYTNAEYAVTAAGEQIASLFASMDDPYMRARSADVRDISARLCRILSEKQGVLDNLPNEAVILCADDLTPSETVQLDREKIAAFVTADGSVNSHTAILARSLEIPAIVGVGEDVSMITDGMTVAVDSFAGKIFLDPDAATETDLLSRREKLLRERALLERYRGLDNVTKDGRRIDVFANVQSMAELEAASRSDAGGIGLFRSEFLYLDRDAPPDEEEQFSVYRAILEHMGQKKVVIRTLDVGADKQASYFDLQSEENPALGLRGIRLCLCHPELLSVQLRALFRASVHGNLAVMFPMITSITEVNELLTICDRTRHALISEGHAISAHVEIGVMIETPAAALIANRLAPLVDFFSVGTNDLSQYTLAIDRQNPGVLRFFDEHHEAVLRLVAMSAEAAHAHGKWIGICGELAADKRLTETFLRMGIDELSVAPSRILSLREHVRSLDLGKSH